MNHEAAILLIEQELERARKKFPTWPGSESREDILFASAIVGEEAGELIRESVKYFGKELDGDVAKCFKEAIQTAVVAIRFLEGR